MRDFEAEFAAIWAVYPKRPGNPKHAAMVEFVKLGKRGALPPMDELIRAIRSYAAYCAKEQLKPNLIAHTRTWLHQHRWADWATPEEAAPAEPQLPAVLKPLVDTVGLGWWKARQGSLGADYVSEDGDTIVIRTPYRFRMSQLETDAHLISRVLSRDVRIELVEVAA